MKFLQSRIAFVVLLLVPLLVLAPSSTSGQTASETARKIVTRVAPQYPNLARSMKIQGTVKADVLVAPNGTVKSVEIKGGHPLLVQAAQNALHEWRWDPAPRETHEAVELKFTL